MTAPNHRQLLALALPLVVAQASTALTGIVDTAVIGRFGTGVDLAAIGLGAVTFQFLYWSFGFLRMSTTGLTAQATGKNDTDEVAAVLGRSTLLGGLIGVGLWVLFPLFRLLALGLFQGTESVEASADTYLLARILGAPAALIGFAIHGWLLGRGRTGDLLRFQLLLNGTNAALDALFVRAGLGVMGVGLGTALAEWVALGFGLWCVRQVRGDRARLFDRAALGAFFTANRDILIRTLALLTAFAWFVNAGNRLGESTAGGNQVLLQFIAVSAFVLDAFAFLAEKEAGEAVGGGDLVRLRVVAWRTTTLAFGFGLLFSGAYATLGPTVLAGIADVEARNIALTYLPWCAAIPTLGVAAFQLDGLLLGATRSGALRNGAVLATVLYISLDLALRPYGNAGVWTAFLATYPLRALVLLPALPGLFAPKPESPC